MVKNVTVAKFELAFTRCRKNLKMIGNLTVKNSLLEIAATEMYHHSKNRSVAFQKCRKMFHFVIFKSSHDAGSKLYCLWFRFQNLPLSKSASKNVPFSYEQEAYPSHFSPFQNVTASRERCLRIHCHKSFNHTTNAINTTRQYYNVMLLSVNALNAAGI